MIIQNDKYYVTDIQSLVLNWSQKLKGTLGHFVTQHSSKCHSISISPIWFSLDVAEVKAMDKKEEKE